MFRTIHNVALMIDRAMAGRDTEPTAAIIDSQTAKAPAPGAERGYDGAKKTVVRKRHIAVDTAGRLLLVHLTPANISDSAGAQAVLDALHSKRPWIKQLFADSAYDRRQLMDKAAFLDFTLDIVKRTEAAFVVLPRRWVVARTFGWMTRHRRLVRDYEARVDVSEAMIDMAIVGLMI
jgi:transposase